MGKHRHVGRLDRRRAPGRLAEGEAAEPQQQRAEGDEQTEDERDREQGWRAKVELTTRNSLMKIPSGGRPGNCDDAEDQAPAEHRVRHREAADLGDLLRSLDLRDMSDGEEDRRFRQAVHGHVQQPGEIRERPAHAEGKGDDAHVLDRRIGEHPFDVAPAVEHEGREDE